MARTKKIRFELLEGLVRTLENLPHGFYMESVGDPWGTHSYAEHTIIGMIDGFKLTRPEVRVLLNGLKDRLGNDWENVDTKLINGYVYGWLEYVMGNYYPKYTRKGKAA